METRESSPLDFDTAAALDLKMHFYHSDAGHFFNGSTNHQHQQHVYELANVVAGGMKMNMNVNMMGVCGKGVFTSSQLEELERQKMIHKYILASIPVPPQLLLSAPPPSQCNTGVELRYPANGSDPEPWRCKRTDGKKWRCSRDVAPEQKYCERHAHKNRPRSRKPVEHNIRSSPYHQTRCMEEWLTRGGNTQDSSKQMPSPSRLMLLKHTTNIINDNHHHHHHHQSVYRPQFGEKQGLMSDSNILDLGLGKEKKLASLRLWMGGDENEWVNSSSSAAPGGPLGEALRLGNANTGRLSSSCEDARPSHALNFIG